MRRKYENRKHITVYLDADEYDKIRKAAGVDGLISEWARERLLGELANHRAEVVRRVPDVSNAGRGGNPLGGHQGVAKGVAAKALGCKHGAAWGMCKKGCRQGKEVEE